MKVLSTFLRAHTGSLALVALIVALTAGLSICVPIFSGIAINAIVDRSSPPELIGKASLIALVAVAAALLGIVERRVGIRVGESIVKHLRVELFGHYHQLQLSYFIGAQSGSMTNRSMNDVTAIRQAVASVGPRLLSIVLQLLFGAGVLFSISPALGGLFLLSLPVFAVPIIRSGRKVALLHREAAQSMGEIAGFLADRYSASGAMLMKLFNGYDREIDDLAARAERQAKIGVRVATASELQNLAVTLVPATVQSLVVVVGGILVFVGEIQVGFVVGAALLLAQLYGRTSSLLNSPAELAAASAAAARVAEVLDLVPELTDPDHPVDRPVGRTAIALDSVSFGYGRPHDGDAAPSFPNARPVLRSVSIEVPAGSTAALVGASGAGKSTIGLLLSRLYDVDRGRVSLGGVDVRDMALADVRSTVGLLPQNPVVFHGSIGSNLRYARPHASDDELWDCLDKVRLAELVRGLPGGLEAVVGEGGLRLSGGERQRLAIARLVLGDPPVVVLDEPTAHLDPETERSLHDALGQVFRDKTVLTIAHRLATVSAMGQILVLDGGRIVEAGSHDELLDRDGHYARMWRAQTFGGSEETSSLR